MTIVGTYLLYLVLSIGLTIWVAQTLFRNGRIFLVDVFAGNEALADWVNHLLVVGCYLINLGYVSLAVIINDDELIARQGVEALAGKMGIVLLVLGAMHFFNLFLFSRIHTVALNRTNREDYLSRRPYPPQAPDAGTTITVKGIMMNLVPLIRPELTKRDIVSFRLPPEDVANVCRLSPQEKIRQ